MDTGSWRFPTEITPSFQRLNDGTLLNPHGFPSLCHFFSCC